MAPYRQILNASQGILDQLHAIRTVTTRDDWFGDVRREFILPVQKFRREMVGSILLYFSLLATTISAKAPLPPYLPPAREARERLVTAIRQLDVVKRKSVRGSSTFLLCRSALMQTSSRSHTRFRLCLLFGYAQYCFQPGSDWQTGPRSVWYCWRLRCY